MSTDPSDGSRCLRLCEFGLAYEVGTFLLYDLCGCPMYMAPEIVNRTGYDDNENKSRYSSLPPEYLFQPVAIETLGPLNASAVNFLVRWVAG